jgi:hypothetical protein
MTWVPPSCTLPTEEQPLRVAEFDALFAEGLLGVARPEPTRVRLVLEVGIEARARDLAERESGCCSFFTFAFTDGPDARVLMDVSVPAGRVAVLDALLSRAVEAAGITGAATS